MLSDYFQFIYINIGHVVLAQNKSYKKNPSQTNSDWQRSCRPTGEKGSKNNCVHLAQSPTIEWISCALFFCLFDWFGAPLLFLTVVCYSLWIVDDWKSMIYNALVREDRRREKEREKKNTIKNRVFYILMLNGSRCCSHCISVSRALPTIMRLLIYAAFRMKY